LNIQQRLFSLFIYLGPWGNLLTPSFFPRAFRLYYLLLPFFWLFFSRIKASSLWIATIFSPFLIYCFFSALLVEVTGLQRDGDQLFRCCLFLCHFFFALGAASWIESCEKLSQLLFGFLKSFFAVLCIGFGLFLGYYAGFFSEAILERFSILTQFGYGILRFSPGSYPNEFGTLCSFVLSIWLLALFIDRTHGPFLPKSLYRLRGVFLFLTLCALILTTTRSAYISFLMGLIYLFYRFGRSSLAPLFWKTFALVAALIGMIFGTFLQSILKASFYLSLQDGSLRERYSAWLEAFSIFKSQPIFGAGFGAFSQLHNVYLALPFELGLFGTSLFVCLVALFWLMSHRFEKAAVLSKEELFVQGVKKLGLIHVFWFAASNHNLHHHLTWLVFFLCFASKLISESALRGGLLASSYRRSLSFQTLWQAWRRAQ